MRRYNPLTHPIPDREFFFCFQSLKLNNLALVNVWGKRFKLPQLTHESFLTIDPSCKIFFWYLPNWTSTNLWCVVLYVTYSTTHQRSVEVQFGRYQKNILQEWSMVKNLSCVSCAAWNVFPINSLLPCRCIRLYWWMVNNLAWNRNIVVRWLDNNDGPGCICAVRGLPTKPCPDGSTQCILRHLVHRGLINNPQRHNLG